ncbi:MAG: hypothetical protein V8T87_00525 [Victivallales bacterium]
MAYAVLDAVLNQDGSLLRTYEGGENSFENAFSVIIYPFTQKDNDAIYKTVFDYLFEQSALKAGQAVPAEKVRFLFVPENSIARLHGEIFMERQYSCPQSVCA